MRIALQHHTDWANFRQGVRTALQQGLSVHELDWHVGRWGYEGSNWTEQSLFEPAEDSKTAGAPHEAGSNAAPANAASVLNRALQAQTPLRLPKPLVQLCQSLIMHAAPERLPLMYTLLQRSLNRPPGSPCVLQDALNPQVLKAQRMVRQVGRDIHKTHAFVRFCPQYGPEGAGKSGVVAGGVVESGVVNGVAVEGGQNDGQYSGQDGKEALQSPVRSGSQPQNASEPPWHVAWFEPLHHTLEASAPFFVKRFTNMRWRILSPQVCLHWDGLQTNRQLMRTPGINAAQGRALAAPDAGQDLWLTYYANTFNPARVKLAMMRKEMPAAYWANLPESQLISPLAQGAEARVAGFLERQHNAA